jgi:hypothetical protein
MRRNLAASAVVHLSLLALLILISEVHPFRPVPAETVAVDIVTPDELNAKVPEPAPTPEPTPPPPVPAPEAATMTEAAAPKASPPAPETPQQQVAPPLPQRETAGPPQAQPSAPPVGFTPPEPDITVKYGVMLGLPEQLPPLPKDAPARADGGDAKDSVATRLPAEVIANFRRHLKTCARLPSSIAPSDNVMIKLRAVMTTEGRLAATPILIEASASAKGPLLMKSARAALQACQPYTMLPPDQYHEWKVMDLTFTPQDFNAS